MSLFGNIVGSLIETVKLPVAAVKDVFSLGGIASGQYEDKGQTYTGEQLEKIKDAATEDD